MDGEVTVEELRALARVESATDADDPDAEPDCRIVDIRPPEAFARGHIPGSENIPAPELTGRVEELDGAGRVVTVCPHGEASVQAARLVAAYEGVDGPVESLRGGLEAWDGPLVTGSTDGDGEAAATVGPVEPDGDDTPAPF